MEDAVERRLDAPTVLLALATAFALSPVLVDAVRQWVEFPWTRSSAIFVPLCALFLWRAERRPPQRDGIWLLGGSIALAVLLLAGGRSAWARLLIPLAVVGLCRARGIADLRTALLAVFALPLPALLNKWTSPALPELVSGLAALPLRAAGAAFEPSADHIRLAGRRLELEVSDGGASLIFLFAGIGWAVALAARAPLPRPVLAWSLCAIPVQVGFWAIALLALGSLGPPAARLALDHLPLAIAAGLFTWFIASGRGSRRPELS